MKKIVYGFSVISVIIGYVLSTNVNADNFKYKELYEVPREVCLEEYPTDFELHDMLTDRHSLTPFMLEEIKTGFVTIVNKNEDGYVECMSTEIRNVLLKDWNKHESSFWSYRGERGNITFKGDGLMEGHVVEGDDKYGPWWNANGASARTFNDIVHNSLLKDKRDFWFDLGKNGESINDLFQAAWERSVRARGVSHNEAKLVLINLEERKAKNKADMDDFININPALEEEIKSMRLWADHLQQQKYITSQIETLTHGIAEGGYVYRAEDREDSQRVKNTNFDKMFIWWDSGIGMNLVEGGTHGEYWQCKEGRNNYCVGLDASVSLESSKLLPYGMTREELDMYLTPNMTDNQINKELGLVRLEKLWGSKTDAKYTEALADIKAGKLTEKEFFKREDEELEGLLDVFKEMLVNAKFSQAEIKKSMAKSRRDPTRIFMLMMGKLAYEDIKAAMAKRKEANK